MVKVTGSKEHSARLRQLAGPEMAKRVGAILFAAGQEIQIEAQLLITTGAVSGKNHVVSAPGQAPNNNDGVLANNIEALHVEPLKVVVSSNAPYAAALEFGTSKMAERPYMRPALANKRDEVLEGIRDAVSVVVKRGGRSGGK